jgi:hypothetical protein
VAFFKPDSYQFTQNISQAQYYFINPNSLGPKSPSYFELPETTTSPMTAIAGNFSKTEGFVISEEAHQSLNEEVVVVLV